MRWVVLGLLLTLALAPSVGAQILRPDVYWRVEKAGRPGEVMVVAYFLGVLESDSPKPVPDARYSAYLLTGGRAEPVEVEARGGIAYASVKVPLEMLLGGRITLNLTASSEMYGYSAYKVVTVAVEPDAAAIGVLASAAIPFLVPLIYMVRRR